MKKLDNEIKSQLWQDSILEIGKKVKKNDPHFNKTDWTKVKALYNKN